MSSPADTSSASGPSPRFLAFLFGGFGLLALLVLIGSWPGYQLARRLAASDEAILRGDFQTVVENLTYVTKHYPDSTGRFVQLGDAYLELEKPEEALKAYETSLEQKPDLNLKARMGRAQFLLGNKAEAMKLLKEAIEKDVNDPRANFYIALYYMEEGNLARAAFFFEAAGADKQLFERSRPFLEEIKVKLLDSPPPNATPLAPAATSSPAPVSPTQPAPEPQPPTSTPQ